MVPGRCMYQLALKTFPPGSSWAQPFPRSNPVTSTELWTLHKRGFLGNKSIMLVAQKCYKMQLFTELAFCYEDSLLLILDSGTWMFHSCVWEYDWLWSLDSDSSWLHCSRPSLHCSGLLFWHGNTTAGPEYFLSGHCSLGECKWLHKTKTNIVLCDKLHSSSEKWPLRKDAHPVVVEAWRTYTRRFLWGYFAQISFLSLRWKSKTRRLESLMNSTTRRDRTRPRGQSPSLQEHPA